MKEYICMAEEYLIALVSANTVNEPGDEKPLAEYIAGILGQEGFCTEIQEVAPNRANVVAWTGASDKKIIMNGHLDVVPPGPGWSMHPFAATEKDGRFYGRGTCDMKGAIAAMMTAAIKVKRENTLKNGQLILTFVADEEINGLGTKYFVKKFEKGTTNWVIIGEPTENQIHIAHRGVVRLKIEIRGRQCHAGQPEKGLNALTLMSKFLVEINGLNLEKQKREQEILPAPTVAATTIHGGVNDNVIPGFCEATLDFRTVPGDTAEGLIQEVESILEAVCGDTGASWTVRPFINVFPGITLPDKDVVRSAVRAYWSVKGTEPQITYFPACCDMSCFTAAGFETIICGPGSINQAHTADEFVDRKQLEQAVSLYEAIILEAGA